MKIKYSPWIIVGILLVCIIFLGIIVSFMKSTQQEKQNISQPTAIPTTYVTPTIFYSQAWQKSNSLSALKTAAALPITYQGLTIEYRPKNDLFFILHTVPKIQAEIIAKGFFQRYGLTLEDVKITYFNVNPSADKNAPPKGFFEGKE